MVGLVCGTVSFSLTQLVFSLHSWPQYTRLGSVLHQTQKVVGGFERLNSEDIKEFVMTYNDYIHVFCPTLSKHIEHLTEVIRYLQEVNLVKSCKVQVCEEKG